MADLIYNDLHKGRKGILPGKKCKKKNKYHINKINLFHFLKINTKKTAVILDIDFCGINIY